MDNKKIIQIINETALIQIEEFGSNWTIAPTEAELRYKYAYNDGILDFKNINPITMDFYEYPCTVKFGDVYDVRYYKFGRGKWWHGAGTIDKEVIAWQPLPKPYREKESMEV